MNQILSMNQQNPDFGNNYNNYNAGGGGNGKMPMDIKMVKRIFGILLIVFGLALFIGGIVSLLGKSHSSGTAGDWPKITATQSDNIITVMMSSDVTIVKAEYSWNNGDSSLINGNGTSDLTQDIAVPNGDNSFSLTVTDSDGKMKTYQGTFTGQVSNDTTLPEIKFTQQGSKLVITATTTTDTKLSYMSYKWDDGQETKIDATNDKTSIEATTDILEGTHAITVVAVKENGVQDSKQQTIVGVKKPKIDVIKSGDYLAVTLTDDTAITSATIMFNNKPIVLTPDRFGIPKIEFKLPMIDGSNRLTMTVTNQAGATQTFDGTATKGL